MLKKIEKTIAYAIAPVTMEIPAGHVIVIDDGVPTVMHPLAFNTTFGEDIPLPDDAASLLAPIKTAVAKSHARPAMDQGSLDFSSAVPDSEPMVREDQTLIHHTTPKLFNGRKKILDRKHKVHGMCQREELITMMAEYAAAINQDVQRAFLINDLVSIAKDFDERLAHSISARIAECKHKGWLEELSPSSNNIRRVRITEAALTYILQNNLRLGWWTKADERIAAE